MSRPMPSSRFVFSLCIVVAMVSGRSALIPCEGAGEGGGGAVLCMSSMRFTLEVLDLVFLVGAGDGEMGGEGESSPVIFGIDKVGGPLVLLAMVEGGAA